jgi:hypothetical protein
MVGFLKRAKTRNLEDGYFLADDSFISRAGWMPKSRGSAKSVNRSKKSLKV